MSKYNHAAALAASHIPYRAIGASRSEPLERSVRIINRDLTGATFQMNVAKTPHANSQSLIGGFTASLGTIETKTYQEFIDECTLSKEHMPPCAELTDSASISTITLSSSKANIQALDDPGQLNRPTVLYYEIKMLTPNEEVMLAGEFIVAGGAF